MSRSPGILSNFHVKMVWAGLNAWWLHVFCQAADSFNPWSPVSIAFSVSGMENDFYCLGVLILINTAHHGKRDRDRLQWRWARHVNGVEIITEWCGKHNKSAKTAMRNQCWIKRLKDSVVSRETLLKKMSWMHIFLNSNGDLGPHGPSGEPGSASSIEFHPCHGPVQFPFEPH